MSIFPFISPEVLESSESSELPMFREYAYDFENAPSFNFGAQMETGARIAFPVKKI